MVVDETSTTDRYGCSGHDKVSALASTLSKWWEYTSIPDVTALGICGLYEGLDPIDKTFQYEKKKEITKGKRVNSRKHKTQSISASLDRSHHNFKVPQGAPCPQPVTKSRLVESIFNFLFLDIPEAGIKDENGRVASRQEIVYIRYRKLQQLCLNSAILTKPGSLVLYNTSAQFVKTWAKDERDRQEKMSSLSTTKQSSSSTAMVSSTPISEYSKMYAPVIDPQLAHLLPTVDEIKTRVRSRKRKRSAAEPQIKTASTKIKSTQIEDPRVVAKRQRKSKINKKANAAGCTYDEYCLANNINPLSPAPKKNGRPKKNPTALYVL
jgi:hypothetical protein